MIIQAITEIAIQVTTLVGDAPTQVRAIEDVCAKAPAGVDPYVNDVLGWVKYGVIAIIIGAGFASVGAMIVGKIGSMGRTAQIGASGLFWTVIGAIAFVVIYGVLNGIVGNGC
jgi:hypothetical protein